MVKRTFLRIIVLAIVVSLGFLAPAISAPTNQKTQTESTVFDQTEVHIHATSPSDVRLHRIVPVPPLTYEFLTFLVLVTSLFLVTLHRPIHRIGDVGDDWRALLLGAPPAAV